MAVSRVSLRSHLTPRLCWLKARALGGVFGLDVDDAELAILTLAMRRHHPEEIDRAAGRGHVRMIALRHQDEVAFVYDRGKLWRGRVRVDHLNAPGGRGHVDVEGGPFHHLPLPLANPRRPVPGP